MLSERIDRILLCHKDWLAGKYYPEMGDCQFRGQILAAIEEYCKDNDIYQVEFGHYEEIWWVPLKTKRVNLVEVLENETSTAENEP